MKITNYLIAFFLIMASFFAYADPHMDHEHGEGEKEHSGYWKAEDCKEISDASGTLLYISGELLEEADFFEKKGAERDAEEAFEAALAFSELAANYAKNFEAYCIGFLH